MLFARCDRSVFSYITHNARTIGQRNLECSKKVEYDIFYESNSGFIWNATEEKKKLFGKRSCFPQYRSISALSCRHLFGTFTHSCFALHFAPYASSTLLSHYCVTFSVISFWLFFMQISCVAHSHSIDAWLLIARCVSSAFVCVHGIHFIVWFTFLEGFFISRYRSTSPPFTCRSSCKPHWHLHGVIRHFSYSHTGFCLFVCIESFFRRVQSCVRSADCCVKMMMRLYWTIAHTIRTSRLDSNKIMDNEMTCIECKVVKQGSQK